MITHIDITGVRYSLDDVTKKYVMKKIGRLDRFLPRHARKSVKAEVVLREVNRTKGNKYECDINLKLPQRTITAKDSTLNMLAAVDIVEAKLTTQLKKYHDEHAFRGGRAQRLLRSIKERVRLTTGPIEA
ncbi:MAG: ribosome-associated translation inhibitor RaiA [Candidatus Saccharimonadales bacterium]